MLLLSFDSLLLHKRGSVGCRRVLRKAPTHHTNWARHHSQRRRWTAGTHRHSANFIPVLSCALCRRTLWLWSQTHWLSCFMQIVLLVIHISLLLAAKRAIICQDLGDQKDTRQPETNPLNKCCRNIHKTCFSEHNRVRTATHTLTSRSFFLLCAVLSLWQPFLQSLILFDVVLILPRLGAFTEALISAIPKVGNKFNIAGMFVSWH